jgi:glucose/arabinose dehydrogenase
MRRIIALSASLLAMALAAGGARAADGGAVSGQLLTGQQAFGGWKTNEPGVRRLIRPSDMPPPGATPSASNAPRVIERPSGAKPQTMPGFEVTEFAHGLREPRVITIAPNGDVFVADSGAGRIMVYRMGRDGRATEHGVFASGLSRPYGIAFYPPGPNPEYVYVGEPSRVVRFAYRSGEMKAGGRPQTVVSGIPAPHHWTRDVVFSPDGKTMFVAVGSGSNDAEGMSRHPPKGFIERNPLGATWGPERDRADVLAFDPEGKNKRIYATGLRNCSGETIQPATGELWCAVNERDTLGNNVPPEYVTHVQQGAFYGWPWYYIGSHPDPHHKGARPDLAGKVTVPDVLIQAHSAPLGIAFYTGRMFPAAYRGDAFVALHGSWNRSERTGYKVVRVMFKGDRPTGIYQDFLTGFVTNDGRVWGRPVDVAVARDGSLLVSDDGSGTIWRVSARGERGADLVSRDLPE